MKVFLTSPQSISDGDLIFTFTGGSYANQPGAVTAAAAFSATGDVEAVAGPAYAARPFGFHIAFHSPSGGVGLVPGLPIAEVAIPVTSGPFTLALASAQSSLDGHAVTGSGDVVVGGTLSVQQVAPTSASVWSIDGTGFTSTTSVQIDGVAVASTTLQSPQRIDVTLAGPAEITGKHIRVSNPDGTAIDYWGGLTNSLFTLPLTASSSGACTLNGPALEDPSALVLYDSNLLDAQVSVTNRTGTTSSTIVAGSTAEVSPYDPANAQFQTSADTPLRALCYYGLQDEPSGVLTWVPVQFQSPAPALAWLASAASLAQSSLAPGEIVTLYGTGIGPDTPVSLVLDSSGNVARQLAGVQISFDGIAAPLLYVSSSQVNAIVPYEIAGQSVTNVQLTFNGATSSAWTLPVSAVSPAIFTESATGTAAALNQDNSVNSAANPAAPGSVVQIFATGAGLTTPPSSTGAIATGVAMVPTQPVSLTIGGIPAILTYAGSAPDAVSGLMQLNAVVPANLTEGVVPVVLTIGNTASPPVYLAVN